MKTMFGSSLPPVVCRRTRVLFTLFVVFVAFNGVPRIFWYVAGFSGLSIVDCTFGIL